MFIFCCGIISLLSLNNLGIFGIGNENEEQSDNNEFKCSLQSLFESKPTTKIQVLKNCFLYAFFEFNSICRKQ